MKKIIIAVIILTIVSIGSYQYLANNTEVISGESKEQIKSNDMLTMMLETESGTGVYEEITASEWPTDGYIFNATLSKCENGGTLTWNDDVKKVVMESNKSDKCYVYFDKVNPLIITSASLEINKDGYVIITNVDTNPIVNISEYYLLLEGNDEYILTSLNNYNTSLLACVSKGDKISYSLYVIDDTGVISNTYTSSFYAQTRVIC